MHSRLPMPCWCTAHSTYWLVCRKIIHALYNFAFNLLSYTFPPNPSHIHYCWHIGPLTLVYFPAMSCLFSCCSLLLQWTSPTHIHVPNTFFMKSWHLLYFPVMNCSILHWIFFVNTYYFSYWIIKDLEGWNLILVIFVAQHYLGRTQYINDKRICTFPCLNAETFMAVTSLIKNHFERVCLPERHKCSKLEQTNYSMWISFHKYYWHFLH